MCIVQTYSVLCQVGGHWWTLHHCCWSWGGTKVALSESVHLQIQFSRSSRVLGDVEEAGTGNTKLTPRDLLHKGDLDWTGQGSRT